MPTITSFDPPASVVEFSTQQRQAWHTAVSFQFDAEILNSRGTVGPERSKAALDQNQKMPFPRSVCMATFEGSISFTPCLASVFQGSSVRCFSRATLLQQTERTSRPYNFVRS